MKKKGTTRQKSAKEIADTAMSKRQQQILQTAIDIISDEGYSSLTMRHLARASDMKLGALQYHFRTWDALLRALVDYLRDEWRRVLESSGGDALGIRGIAEIMLSDNAQELNGLWPQLWAMEQVEPLVSDLLEDVYAEYLQLLEKALEAAGIKSPRAEALCLMALMESEALFTGRGKRWESDRSAVRETILNFIDERYGD
ncbi:TetR/AcrR family transcriptional regulator [Gammaproteobacteria bacterium]|nr:TetR/AcrR family transcriptional regulator [Gammaproteobacteria bacterium]